MRELIDNWWKVRKETKTVSYEQYKEDENNEISLIINPLEDNNKINFVINPFAKKGSTPSVNMADSPYMFNLVMYVNGKRKTVPFPMYTNKNKEKNDE